MSRATFLLSFLSLWKISFLRQGFPLLTKAGLELLCSPDWPSICRSPPVSVLVSQWQLDSRGICRNTLSQGCDAPNELSHSCEPQFPHLHSGVNAVHLPRAVVRTKGDTVYEGCVHCVLQPQCAAYWGTLWVQPHEQAPSMSAGAGWPALPSKQFSKVKDPGSISAAVKPQVTSGCVAFSYKYFNANNSVFLDPTHLQRKQCQNELSLLWYIFVGWIQLTRNRNSY